MEKEVRGRSTEIDETVEEVNGHGQFARNRASKDSLSFVFVAKSELGVGAIYCRFRLALYS